MKIINYELGIMIYGLGAMSYWRVKRMYGFDVSANTGHYSVTGIRTPESAYDISLETKK